MMPDRYHQDVRTTLTLDDDVWKRLQAEARRTGQPFREVVNAHLRDSLARRRSYAAAPPFRVIPVDLGGPAAGRSYDDIAGLLDAVEG
jgi:hypothetical protein